MGRRPSFSSLTKMDRLFQRNERAKQGLFSKKLIPSPASRALANSLSHPKKLLVHAHVSDG